MESDDYDDWRQARCVSCNHLEVRLLVNGHTTDFICIKCYKGLDINHEHGNTYLAIPGLGTLAIFFYMLQHKGRPVNAIDLRPHARLDM